MMKYTLSNIRSFLDLASKSHGTVWAQSINGNCYDLKNEESQYIVAAEMLQNGDNTLEFFASDLNTQIGLGLFLREHRTLSA